VRKLLRWVVLLLVFTAALATVPPALAGQEPSEEDARLEGRPFLLEQNDPNPVEPDTWIPFSLGTVLYEHGEPPVVSLRIYNVLRQLVGVPVAIDHPNGRDLPVLDLEYPDAGRHVAYWNGRDVTGRRAPSGVYYVQLTVNNESRIRKMIVLGPREGGRRWIPWPRRTPPDG
jgi:hypothetical protein